MNGKYILNEQGEPQECDDLMKWGRWMELPNARRVAETFVNGIRISTVFLGLDHQFGRGEPILYETMVFGGPLDQESDRYHTRTEAERGHSQMVDRVLAAQRESAVAE